MCGAGREGPIPECMGAGTAEAGLVVYTQSRRANWKSTLVVHILGERKLECVRTRGGRGGRGGGGTLGWGLGLWEVEVGLVQERR